MGSRRSTRWPRAPALYDVEHARFPAIARICEVLGGTTAVTPVPIPFDCTDGFAEGYYGRPEALLDPAVRRSQSGWAFLDPTQVRALVERLRADLADGTWDARYGHLRRQPEFIGSLRLVRADPRPSADRGSAHA